jgi:predicted transcriptional regulator
MKTWYAFVMMVREKYWIAYRDRKDEGKEVHAYVARGVAPPKNAEILLFYVSRPVKSLCGYANFIEREVGDSAVLWSKHCEESVLKSLAEYEEFVGTARSVSFVRFTDLKEAVNVIHLRNLLSFFGVKKLSRKGFYINKDASDRLISMMR